MRLIDVNALMDFANNHKDKTIDSNDIARFPTVDAVPVHCGECRKYHTPDCHAGHEQAAADYCSRGTRKDGEK